MQAGTTYYFAIGGNSPTAYQLDVFIPPVNDQCAGAIVIPSLPYTAPPASTTYARPDFLACISTAQRDIYYVFTPSTTYNSVTISLCGSSFDTFLSLASGSCAGLSCLDTNDDSDCGAQSTLRDKTLVAGTTYYIIVAGYSSDHFGSVSLTITGIPLNSCATPRVIPSIPYSFASNTASTASSAITCRDGSTVAGVTGAIWFSFTPESTINHVYITSCTSFDSVLLFTSGSCNSLTCSAPVTGNAEFCLAQNSRGSQISDVTLLSGVRYLFVVTGSSAADYGAFTFSIGIDSSASLSISAPAANSIVGGTQLVSLLISGLAGTLDAQGTVTLTISDSSTGTSDIVVSAVVGFDGRWSVPVNILSLADGNIVVDGRLVDPSQNTATTRLTFTKDSSTFVFIAAPTPNSVINSAAASSLAIQGTGEVGGSVIVTIVDGDSSTPNIISSPVIVNALGGWSVATSIAGLRDGTIRISATITDTAGNTQTSPNVQLSKDTTVSVSILSPTSFQFIISQTRAVSVTISGFGDPGTKVVVVASDDNNLTEDVSSKEVAVSPVGTWSVTVNVLTLNEGNILFTATGSDSANNVQSQTITLKKDTKFDPPTTILTPTDQSTVGDTLVISGTAEPNSRVSLTISGTGTITRTVAVPISGSWTTTVGISSWQGIVRISGTTRDQADNSGPISGITVNKP